MKGRRRLIQTVGRRLELPNSRRTVRARFLSRLKKNVATKSIRSRERIFQVESPIFPFPGSAERDHLEMGGAKANASRGVRNALHHKARLNALLPIDHFSRHYQTRLNDSFPHIAGLQVGKNIKLHPSFEFL